MRSSSPASIPRRRCPGVRVATTVAWSECPRFPCWRCCSRFSCSGAPQSDRLLRRRRGALRRTGRGGSRSPSSRGRILALVEPADAAAWRRSAAAVVDLGGAHVYPGFTEAHGHFAGYGAALEQVDLIGTASLDEVVARAREAARHVPPGEWVLGRGWDQNDWPDKAFPPAATLSAAVPDHPVRCGAWTATPCSSTPPRSPSPASPRRRPIRRAAASCAAPGAADRRARRRRGRADRPRGPPPPPRRRRAPLPARRRRLASLGITEIHDAGTSRAELAVLRAMQRPARCRCAST